MIGSDGRSADNATPEEGRPSTRRRLLKWLIGASAAAFAGALALPALALRSLQVATQNPDPGDLLVYAPTDADAPVGQPLRAADLAVGAGTQAYPAEKTDNPNNLIEVVRLADGDQGLVAYSAICTHLGCAVFADLNQEGMIACPCHASLFAPAEGAAVVAGPAPRPLPSIPVSVDPDGNVVVAGTFDAPVGPV
jgi:Rieske Fe-S protein